MSILVLWRQPKYTPFRGAALRRLAARARRQTISAFESLILHRAPLTNFGWNPRTRCNLRKFGMGVDSQNWKIGKGIPSPRFGAGIGNVLRRAHVNHDRMKKFVRILEIWIYRLLHLECHLISISTLNLLTLFSTECGKRDLAN